LIDSIADSSLRSLLKGKYDKVKWIAVIKIILFILAVLLSIFFMVYYRADFTTPFVWALFILFVVLAVSVLGLIYQINVIKSVEKL